MLEELRKIRNQRPFVPYTVVLTDGRRFHITDQFHVSFGGGQITVGDEPNDRFIHFHISALKEIVVDKEVGEHAR